MIASTDLDNFGMSPLGEYYQQNYLLGEAAHSFVVTDGETKASDIWVPCGRRTRSQTVGISAATAL